MGVLYHGTRLCDAGETAEGGESHCEDIACGRILYRLRDHGDAVCDLGQSREKELCGDGQPQFLYHGCEHGKQHNVTAKSGQGFKTVHNAGVYDFKIHLRSGCRSFYCRRRREPAGLAQRVPPVGERRQIEQQIACRDMGGQGELLV